MKNAIESAVERAQEFAIEQLSDEIMFMKAELQRAKESGDTKHYCSVMRLYLPALKEYVRLYGDQGGSGADELLNFANGGV